MEVQTLCCVMNDDVVVVVGASGCEGILHFCTYVYRRILYMSVGQ